LRKEETMKIKITMKDPDTMYDTVQEAVTQEVKAMGLPEDEEESLIELRTEKEIKKMGKWFEYEEYLAVEFDTEAMTATVCVL
jgi:hypothetical protein